jgi:hypothetical protein
MSSKHSPSCISQASSSGLESSGHNDDGFRTSPGSGTRTIALVFSSADNTMYWINEWSHTVVLVDAPTDT